MSTIFLRISLLSIAGFALVALNVEVRGQATPPVAPLPVTQSRPSQTEKVQPRRPIKRGTSRQARVTMVKDQEPVAPQVVTIVHRLNGAKLLRYLLRESGERGTVETIDPEAIINEVHASIIAGWALEDGKTIAARLPQAAAEFEVTRGAGTPTTGAPPRSR